jgi:hypothetical protein
MERAAEAMLARHRAEDAQPREPSLLAKDVAPRERLVRVELVAVSVCRVSMASSAAKDSNVWPARVLCFT